MSTSPEAKQAAEALKYRWTIADWSREDLIDEAVKAFERKQAYDAATAKLREELDRITRLSNELYTALREGKPIPHADSFRLSEEVAALVRQHDELRQQLAHQQPSEGNWERLSGGGLLYDSEKQPSADVNKGNVWKVLQPNATTPDVEKIAQLPPLWSNLITRQGALAYFKQFLNGDKGMASAEVLADVMLLVQHQAREPLVALLREALSTFYDKDCDLGKRLQASLTGTEEK